MQLVFTPISSNFIYNFIIVVKLLADLETSFLLHTNIKLNSMNV